MIQNTPGEISSWDKAKDAALVAFLGVASMGILKLMVDVAELKTSIAVYQTQQETLKAEVGRIRNDMDLHLRERGR